MQDYRLAVCEDDRAVREGIVRFCEQVLTEAGIPHEITELADVEEAERFLAGDGRQLHLLILDIETGNKTGMELAKEMRDRNDRRSILFVTGYEKYLPAGYEVQPIQFLLKPIDWDKLKKAILTDWEVKHRPGGLILKKHGRNIRIPFRSILYAEASGNHGVNLTTEQGTETFPLGFSGLEALLPEDQFIRCHKSYLVGLRHVRELDRQGFVLDNACRLPVGRAYEKECRRLFLEFAVQ